MADNLKIFIDEHKNKIVFSSVDNFSCKFVLYLIKKTFIGERVLFIASGLLDTIKEIQSHLNANSTFLNINDGKKLFVKKMPKLYSFIENDSLLQYAANEWVSTIYEQRTLLFLDDKIVFEINSILNQDEFSDELISEIIKKNYKCKIESVPESDYHYTFMIKSDNIYFPKIMKNIIKNPLASDCKIVYVNNESECYK